MAEKRSWLKIRVQWSTPEKNAEFRGQAELICPFTQVARGEQSGPVRSQLRAAILDFRVELHESQSRNRDSLRLRRARQLPANNAANSVAFPPSERGRHSVAYFRSSILPPASSSAYASLWLLAESHARLEAGMKSLLLFRRALSSPTMCRFIPALSGRINPDE